ncbi:MAG: HAD family acid phosphatase [Candidatus Aminicenantales bacterium]
MIRQPRRALFLAPAAAVLILAALASTVVQTQAPINPQEPKLWANLYVQTSAEYEALCLQTYGWAAERLREKLAVLREHAKPPAVVMDLDETVLDNGGFQTFMYRQARPDSEFNDWWSKWEVVFAEEPALVPGAKAFIAAAEAMGVSVVYISNRMATEPTIKALGRLGLDLADINSRLKLPTDNDPDKTARRRSAEKRYEVLMWVGDNLRDFAEEFVMPSSYPKGDADRVRAIEDRKSKVRSTAFHWGHDWIVLPNPVYGEWPRPFGQNPGAFLKKTSLKAD